MEVNHIYQGEASRVLAEFPKKSINCCVTSPPYWGLRDYGSDDQIGLEDTLDEYVDKLVSVFREVKKVLRDDGTLWLNLGDSFFGGGYSNHRINGEDWKQKMNGDKRRSRQQDLIRANPNLKSKDLVGIPWTVAFALRMDGWYLRSDIVWSKPNPMPESVKDRPTKSHEYIFLFAKSKQYYYDHESIKETSVSDDSTKRNKRSVWSVPTRSFREAHFATFPPDLVKPCIIAGCPKNGIVLDPFFGSGTTGLVANQNERNYIGIEINDSYAEIARRRVVAE